MKNKENHTTYTNIMAFNYKTEKGMGLTKSQEKLLGKATLSIQIKFNDFFTEPYSRHI